jgi:peptide/nickel transport system permease protein
MPDGLALKGAPPMRQHLLGRLWRQRQAQAALCLFGAIVAVILIGPLLSNADPLGQDFNLFGAPAGASADHWLGTDELGRDVLIRLIYGGRMSLAVGIASSLVATLIGTFAGAVSGYYGGWVDRLVMRAVDAVMSIPVLPLILMISSFIKPSPLLLVLIIGSLGWMGTARLVRSQFLVLKHREFVEAARGLGMSDRRVMWRHILPNALSPIIVSATLAVGNGIMIESAMSFLGLGVQPPTPTWGNMLNAAGAWLPTAPLMAIAPGLMIFLTVIAVNFLGDGLRAAVDPR